MGLVTYRSVLYEGAGRYPDDKKAKSGDVNHIIEQQDLPEGLKKTFTLIDNFLLRMVTMPSKGPLYLAESWEEFSSGNFPVTWRDIQAEVAGGPAHRSRWAQGALVLANGMSRAASVSTAINNSDRIPVGHSSTPTSNIAQESLRYSTQPALAEPKTTSEALNANDRSHSIRLTREALIRATGAAPEIWQNGATDKEFSDAGIEGTNAGVFDTADTWQGQPGLLGGNIEARKDWWNWDGTRWLLTEEEERIRMEKLIDDNINLWTSGVPPWNGMIDMNNEKFKSGCCPVLNTAFDKPIEHPPTTFEPQDSMSSDKQRNQTAAIDATRHSITWIKMKKYQQQIPEVEARRMAAIANKSLPPHPFAPKIPIYLRPAQKKDIPGITAVYNSYTLHSIAVEDQEFVGPENISDRLANIREELMPFVVAIKGKVPRDGRPTEDEMVLGFGFAEGFYGLRGSSRGGRSRYTATIEFYVHMEYLQNRIGHSLLDSILLGMNPVYANHGGYDWINPMREDQELYTNPKRRYHQIMIYRAFEAKDDPNYGWMKTWLAQYRFFEAARLQSVYRSTVRLAGPKFCDKVIFQLNNDLEAEYVAIH